MLLTGVSVCLCVCATADPLKSAHTASTFRMLGDIYSSQGVRGLFVGLYHCVVDVTEPTGLTPRIAKVAPACAIMISTYEAGKHFFAERNSTTLRT